MTLSRQLMLSGLLILICLFTGMITFVVRNTQSFLDYQLASHSQDTATALGLTLTTMMTNNDVVTANRVVDAIWDRGYYKSIIIEKQDGNPLISRTGEIKFYGVPGWFIKLMPLRTATKEAVIMDGWKRVGKVKIESNPGFAYKQIWNTFLESSLWFVMTMILAFILGSLLLYIILRPLRAITAQAIAICNQQFSVQERLPWTIDLRLVVEAMNNMSTRLKRLFEEQAHTSEMLREQAYTDPVTKVGNRLYFDMQFDYLLKDKEKGGTGALLLIEIQNFKAYNDRHGYQEGDALLKNVANAIRLATKDLDNTVITHAKGASFFVILPHRTKEIASEVCTSICQQFSEFYLKLLSKQSLNGHIGMVLFSLDDDKKEIMSKVDMALSQAQSQGENVWYCIDELNKQAIHGTQEWEKIFNTVIRDNKILLHFQETKIWSEPVQKTYEVLMRLRLDEHQPILAGTFLPMAERLHLVTALDMLVIQNVIKIIASTQPHLQKEYAVNLSPASLDDEDFKKWLLERVKKLGKNAKFLIIEFPEYGVINRIDKAREFFLQFSLLGGKTAIDHYGQNFSTFSYLFNLKLNYLKIDGGFIRDIQEKEENQFFIRSLVDIAHSLGILVIAEAVEKEAEFVAIKQLKVDGAQGYYIGKPTEFIFDKP